MSSHWHHSLTTSAPVYRGKCKYKSGRCTNERTLKENGEPHTLCEPHRLQHNKNQRKSDIKRRRLKKQSQMQDAMAHQVLTTSTTRIANEPRNATSVVHPISFNDTKSYYHPPPALSSNYRRPMNICTDITNDLKPSPLYARPKLEARRTIESTLLPPLYHSIAYPPRYPHPMEKAEDNESKPPAPPLPDEWSHEDIVILTEMVGLQSSSRPASRSSASLSMARTTVRLMPMHLRFINGLSRAYDDEFPSELNQLVREDTMRPCVIASVDEAYFHHAINQINNTLTDYWPCLFCVCCGYACCVCTGGLSLLCPHMCISDVEITFFNEEFMGCRRNNMHEH
ncbi:hypothetical protein THRCLA_21337 [Thraustotheca clavata]|uniref:Uncharacterized protein n=1 Tax=Thraustotheca clavata TaxID=74557 RepID=A0A1V9ZXK3_9STRA|nr:hypothetical protein THRCLA_21337 [Thraustotheca clavata]